MNEANWIEFCATNRKSLPKSLPTCATEQYIDNQPSTNRKQTKHDN